ncbi:uncharacterized protein PAC_10254 [Phialocephala subalpina]|uniref:N-acetyltransferase domain-containing protein n=1 Tax=Phialocephala subalpina TaxID=576137 RepID=A0A1L7X5P7_9HELO|nr:uncharacterized protein PAC_10254 [Phialocephala subalpina]
MALPASLKLETGSPEDVKEAFQVMLDTYDVDTEIWKIIVKDCDQKEILPWVLKTFAVRWGMPDISTYKIVEESSGKIVAFAFIQTPWKYVPAMTQEMKNIALSEELPPLLEGMDYEAFIAFFESLGAPSQHGYDPVEDYHRKGTVVHPGHQKKGLGTALTKVWNEVTDKSGDKTWCPCWSTSVKMFRDHGFKDVGEVDAHLERWGGSGKNSITYVTVRYPPGSEPEAKKAGES